MVGWSAVTVRTEPSIQVAQNTARAKQFIAAQARLYSDAKTIHNWRLALVCFFSGVTSVCAIALPDARTYIGALAGFTLLAIALLVTSLEKRRRFQASAIQEEFDTNVFQLPWNGLQAERPSPTVIAKAAARYDGDREANWYPDTKETLRPFDILICQTSNLGWGTAMHRLWAALLGIALVLIATVIGLVTWALDLSFIDCVLALVVPALAPIKELAELITTNLENATSKESTERKLIALWKDGLRGQPVSTESCRTIQDKILHFRQSNAYVPDWLDNLRRAKNETAMRSSATAMIEEARDRGYA